MVARQQARMPSASQKRLATGGKERPGAQRRLWRPKFRCIPQLQRMPRITVIRSTESCTRDLHCAPRYDAQQADQNSQAHKRLRFTQARPELPKLPPLGPLVSEDRQHHGKAEGQRIDAFKLWCWRRLLKVPWTARRSNQSILREINPESSLD